MKYNFDQNESSSRLCLSIIVPVFNVDSYLGRCLESLLNQDISTRNYEIIIIDDGSVDKSLEIAESYVHHSTNIELISQVNKGLGAARNTGIMASKGKYLLFVDSDDYIKPKSLKELIETMDYFNLDMLRFNHYYINEDGGVISKRKNSEHSIKYSDNVVDGETFLTDYLGWACYAWSFVLNASFIKNNTLVFKEGIYFEDVDWLMRTLPLARKVRSIDKTIYYYIQRHGSITNSKVTENKNKTITDKFQNLNALECLVQKSNNQKVISWCKGMISLNLIDILYFVENELPDKKQEILDYINSHSHLLKSYRFTFKQWCYLQIIKINPRIYCYLKNCK